MIASLPPVGAYLRPVGLYRYSYCIRVVRQLAGDESNHRSGIEGERWGLQDGIPHDDGHVMRGWFADLLPGPGMDVWRERARCEWDLEPLYWRRMSAGSHGQGDLFA
ncbi:hypothetical protein [Melaminivora sp.]|uniref:hypothetical protein n=1 Tax=Melaminivora sp. TaxID=1933032 RepID=UPI0028ACD554|nr:hypothetical protein [Melaminivora sp.]